MKAVHRSRLVIIAVAALFLLPVLVATYLNSSWSSWAPTATKNFGTLVQPPVLVDAFASDDPEANWTLAYDGRGGCGAGCQEDLKLLSQIERAMGRHADRAGRAVMIDPRDPDMEAVRGLDPALRLVIIEGSVADAASAWTTHVPPGGAFIIDPQGHLIMTYTAPLDGTGIRKDLNHLLKWTDDS